VVKLSDFKKAWTRISLNVAREKSDIECMGWQYKQDSESKPGGRDLMMLALGNVNGCFRKDIWSIKKRLALWVGSGGDGREGGLKRLLLLFSALAWAFTQGLTPTSPFLMHNSLLLLSKSRLCNCYNLIDSTSAIDFTSESPSLAFMG